MKYNTKTNSFLLCENICAWSELVIVGDKSYRIKPFENIFISENGTMLNPNTEVNYNHYTIKIKEYDYETVAGSQHTRMGNLEK